MSDKIYRVILDPKFWIEDEGVEVFYPIGCSKTYTGFFTQSLKNAINIISYLNDCYSMDTGFRFEFYPAVIVETNLSNVRRSEDYKKFKTDDNKLFDEAELFVTEIFDKNKLVILRNFEIN